jgi:drug/metabolite transporter (DMT)-like permease
MTMSLVLAIMLGLLAFAIFNIGLVLEKKGADNLPAIENTSAINNLKNFLGNKEWLVGFLLTNVQWIFYLIALSMAPLSVIAPMLGFGMVILTIFSHSYLHEKIRRMEIASIGIIILGIVLVGITAVSETPKTIEQMFGLFGAPLAIIYLIGISIAAGIPCGYTIRSEYKFAPAITFGIAAGIGVGIGASFSKGVSAGVENILAAAGNGLWWVMLAFMLAGNVISLVLLQVGFQKGKAIIVGPLFNVLGMIIPVFSGIIILGEWQGIDPLKLIFQIVGIIIIMVGIVVLSFYGEKKKQAEEVTNQII